MVVELVDAALPLLSKPLKEDCPIRKRGRVTGPDGEANSCPTEPVQIFNGKETDNKLTPYEEKVIAFLLDEALAGFERLSLYLVGPLGSPTRRWRTSFSSVAMSVGTLSAKGITWIFRSTHSPTWIRGVTLHSRIL